MNALIERNRDGQDFVDYVYDGHRWVYRPLPPTGAELEAELQREEARAERYADRDSDDE